VVKENYVPYAEGGQKLHWTLNAEDGVFTLTREDGLSITGEDQSYDGGYVGIQLYAQQAEFDSFTIVPHDDTTGIQPAGKLATVWSDIRGY
jgi:hypothetical protein